MVLLFGTNGTNGTSVLLTSCVTIGDVIDTSSAYSVFCDRPLALRFHAANGLCRGNQAWR
jgi:hypothetical protein